MPLTEVDFYGRHACQHCPIETTVFPNRQGSTTAADRCRRSVHNLKGHMTMCQVTSPAQEGCTSATKQEHGVNCVVVHFTSHIGAQRCILRLTYMPLILHGSCRDSKGEIRGIVSFLLSRLGAPCEATSA